MYSHLFTKKQEYVKLSAKKERQLNSFHVEVRWILYIMGAEECPVPRCGIFLFKEYGGYHSEKIAP